MALQPAAMFKQNESTNNQQQLHEARCQPPPPATDCSRAPSAVTTTVSAANQSNSSSSSSAAASPPVSFLAHSSSQLGALSPQAAPSSPLPNSTQSLPTNEHKQRQQQASLAAAAAAMATQERLALLLHQQQLQEQQSFEARAPSSTSSAGSFEEPEEDSFARRLALLRDFEAMSRNRRQQQAMDTTSDEVENSSSSSATNDQMQLEGGEQEMALNLSVSKRSEHQEQKPDLTQHLFQLHNEQNLHSQLERQQIQFQEVNSRLYEHLLAYQMRTAAAASTTNTTATGQPTSVHQPALSPTGSSTSSSGATSPPLASVNMAHLLQTHHNQSGFSNPNQHHPCHHHHHHHHQSSTSSSHHSHSSSASSSSSSGAADSLTGYSPTNERRRHHFNGATSSSGSSSSSTSASCQQPVEQMSPAAAAVAAQQLHQHLLNLNTDPANRLLLNQQLHDRSSQLHSQSAHQRDLFFNSHQAHLQNNLMSNLSPHNNQNHSLLLAGLSHQQQQLGSIGGKTHPMLQHELGPMHKADADDLDRIRNFIEQFKARRGALGLTQKQAAQCFRAYTNDRYAFSDNFVGHFEGFQFRPQTAMTIADSLAEWLEYAESETRQGRQLSFMPGKVKETRKRKYEVIRIRDSAKRVLVEAFEKNRSPSTSELEQLSKRTNIPSRNIEIFFKNRRTSRQYHH